MHPALYERGLQQFFASQQKTQWVAPTLAIVGSAIFFLIATITHPNNINARTLTYSLIVMVQLSWLTWQVWGYSSQYSDYKILKLPAIALALLAITYLFRAAHHAPLLNQPGVFLNDPIFGVTLLFTALFTTIRGCVDLVLVQTRLENSLRTAQKELEQRANFDHLSGLRSRYFFTASLPQLQAQSERIKQPLNLLLFDIDFFKHVNDMHGHPAGDAVITTVGQAVKSTLRASDIAGRLGGDEIAILYISNSEEIPGLITRLRQQIELQTQNLLGGPVTVSIGLSICLSNDHFEQTYQRADTALYAAKSAGRNCCFQYN
ncbi:MAG: GGDEF domain-containing protein, partial [Burkholderiales bacterium]|nr:GGDEF domain-containing protein [Burkholderiales bacterium]